MKNYIQFLLSLVCVLLLFTLFSGVLAHTNHMESLAYDYLLSDSSLVLYLPFDANDASDHSGKSNDGVLHGPIWSSKGKFGGGFSFDGTNDWMSVDNSAPFIDFSNTDFTISLWVNAVKTGTIGLIGSGENYRPGATMLNMGSGGKAVFLTYSDSVGLDKTYSDKNSIVPDVWTHIVAVKKGGEKKVFVNGVLASSSEGLSGDISSDSDQITIGARPNGSGWLFEGILDEVVILKRALSDTEIFELTNLLPAQMCSEDWKCSNWGTCLKGIQERECVDVFNCGTQSNIPPFKMECDANTIVVPLVKNPVETPCSEEWECSEFGECQDGVRKRSCTDANVCGTQNEKPPLLEECDSQVETSPRGEVIREVVPKEKICEFTRVDWTDSEGERVTEVLDGEIVYLTVEATGCEGRTVNFTTFETDGIFGREDKGGYYQIIQGGVAKVKVVAAWEPDPILFGILKGNPEFVAHAETNPEGDTGVLTVLPREVLASPVDITPSLVSSKSTCVAPCSVFFDARGTTHANLVNHWEELIDLSYSWNFGDPSSGNWVEGASGQRKNVDTGFVAGHVYEQPGSYDVVLSVTDGDGPGFATESVTITVLDDPSVIEWTGTGTICLSNDVDHSGCPSGALQVNNVNDFDVALETNNCVDSAVRCLFKRGDTFNMDSEVLFTSPGPTLIGAYGSGPKPRIDTTSTAFRFGAGNGDITLMDLDISADDTDNKNGIALTQGVPIRELLVLRVDFTDFDSGINIRGGTTQSIPGVNIHKGVSFIDSTILSGAGFGGNDAFLMWEDSLMMGNRIGDKEDGAGTGVGEHVIRSKFSHGVVYSHNSLGLLTDPAGSNPSLIGCGSIRLVMKLVSGLASSHGAAGYSREFIIADNFISSCTINTQSDISVSPTSDGNSFEGHQEYIIERNHFSKQFAGETTNSHTSLIVTGAHAVVRNNIFDLSSTQLSSNPRGIEVRVRTPSDNPDLPTQEIRVYGNTCYKAAGSIGNGECIVVMDHPSVFNNYVQNNLLYDSVGTATHVRDSSSSTTTCLSCNRIP